MFLPPTAVCPLNNRPLNTPRLCVCVYEAKCRHGVAAMSVFNLNHSHSLSISS